MWEPYAPYHEECMDSLKDEPIALHLIPGVAGDVGIGRWNGYHTGDAEFVSFVDDDDVVIPGIFEKCYQALDENPDAIGVHTREWIYESGAMTLSQIPNPNWTWDRYFFFVHHVVVYRMERVMPYGDAAKECKVGFEHFMNMQIMMDGHRFHYIEDVGYIWRGHSGSIRELGMTEPFRTRANNWLKQAKGV